MAGDRPDGRRCGLSRSQSGGGLREGSAVGALAAAVQERQHVGPAEPARTADAVTRKLAPFGQLVNRGQTETEEVLDFFRGQEFFAIHGEHLVEGRGWNLPRPPAMGITIIMS